MAYYDEEDLLPGEEFYYATDPLEGQALRTSLVGRGMDVPPLPENWRAPAPLPSGYGVTYSTQGPADLSVLREGEIGNGVMAQVPINAQNIVGAYAPGRPNVPIPTQGDMGMSPDFMQGVQEAYTKLPYKQAESAVTAAIRYQGLLFYQRAIRNGEPADEAITKYGPAMFYSHPSAYPAAVRQLTPPRMTPAQVAANEIARRRLELDRDRIAAINERAKQPKRHFGPNGEVIEVDDAGNVKVLKTGTPKPSKATVGEAALARAESADVAARIIEKEKELENINPETRTGFLGFTGEKIPNPAYAAKKKEIDLLKEKIKKIDSTEKANEPAATPDELVITKPTISEAPIKLPKTKNELVVGKLYITSKGNLRWDGEKFVR